MFKCKSEWYVTVCAASKRGGGENKSFLLELLRGTDRHPGRRTRPLRFVGPVHCRPVRYVCVF